MYPWINHIWASIYIFSFNVWSYRLTIFWNSWCQSAYQSFIHTHRCSKFIFLHLFTDELHTDISHASKQFMKCKVQPTREMLTCLICCIHDHLFLRVAHLYSNKKAYNTFILALFSACGLLSITTCVSLNDCKEMFMKQFCK